MTKNFLLTLLSFVTTAAIGQADCMNGRYVDYDHFQSVTVTSDITYGQNTGVTGQTQSLELDIYEPTGDLNDSRPVVIVTFGGSFIAGSKEDVSGICEVFAKLGYVAVAPEYRVGFFIPNAYSTSSAVLRGAHDVKAAIRYLYRSVAIDGNPFGLDTNRIFVGGVSAGAISAMHAVYLDEQSEIPPILQPDTALFGNVAGLSGNLGYSDDVLGVWSMSGALYDTLSIIPGDPGLVSVHEVGDAVVPYFTEEVEVLSIPTGLIASGSHDVHRYMDAIGVENCLLSYPGNDHVGYLSSDFQGSIGFIADFLRDKTCGTIPDCGAIIAAVEEREEELFSVYPNPVTDFVRISAAFEKRVRIMDQAGRVVFDEMIPSGDHPMDIRHLSRGMYTMHVIGSTARSERIIVSR